MSDWLKDYQMNSEKLSNIPFSLESLGDSFLKTGNNIMGERMFKIADDISECNKKMSNAVSRCINESFKNSQKMSSTILEAALAGSKLEREK